MLTSKLTMKDNNVLTTIYYIGIHTPCPSVFAKAGIIKRYWVEILYFLHNHLLATKFETLVCNKSSLSNFLIKFMDLLDMTNMAQIHEFRRRISGKIFIFQDTVSKFGD